MKDKDTEFPPISVIFQEIDRQLAEDREKQQQQKGFLFNEQNPEAYLSPINLEPPKRPASLALKLHKISNSYIWGSFGISVLGSILFMRGLSLQDQGLEKIGLSACLGGAINVFGGTLVSYLTLRAKWDSFKKNINKK